MQRLAKVFDALGQVEQASNIATRAMAQTEATSDNLQALSRSANRDQFEIRKELMTKPWNLSAPLSRWAGPA